MDKEAIKSLICDWILRIDETETLPKILRR